MSSTSNINDLLQPGATVPVDAHTTQKLVEAAKGYRSKKYYSQAFPKNTSANIGMTLRDYFAAKAMQGAIADRDYGEELDDFASWAYCVADSMLEARDK